ncbi:GNAT family N-acetyltransferase [Alicyclobacillus fodiniaquatilis]|uniref:GNAT family N-acetyltransferase n=1 Tax=Alicyclobacillus fodiniaquatilis TaxID=1661150 RepID=A0ABW4JGA6_9BACL
MINIRDAQITDLPDLLRIYNQAILTTTATFDIEVQTLAARTEWFHHYGGQYPLIVAEENGEIRGYASLSRFREKEAYARTVESSVYIDEQAHGRGIGKALMQELLQRAVALHHHVVIASITSGNETSVRLHTKLGFEFVGRLKEVGYKFDKWQDVDYYQIFLPNC